MRNFGPEKKEDQHSVNKTMEPMVANNGDESEQGARRSRAFTIASPSHNDHECVSHSPCADSYNIFIVVVLRDTCS